MKKLLLTLAVVLFAGSNAVRAQVSVKAAPSETVELMYVMMHLSDAPLVPGNLVRDYQTFTDTYFAPYKTHPAIRFINEELLDKGLLPSIPMPAEIGVNSALTNGRFVYTGHGQDWSDGVRDRFVEEVDRFYHDTDFHKFYTQVCDKFYPAADSLFREILIPKLDTAWINRYVPVEKPMSFDFTICYLSGNWNFNVDKQDGSATEIIGIDTSTLAQPETLAPVIMHEYQHTFWRPLIKKYYADLEKSGAIIYPKICEQATAALDGTWNTVLNEAMVRASVNVFMRRDGFSAQAIAENMGYDKEAGIYWIEELTDLMCDYEAHRDQYPTLDSFMPRVIDFYNDLAAKAEK